MRIYVFILIALSAMDLVAQKTLTLEDLQSASKSQHEFERIMLQKGFIPKELTETSTDYYYQFVSNYNGQTYSSSSSTYPTNDTALISNEDYTYVKEKINAIVLEQHQSWEFSSSSYSYGSALYSTHIKSILFGDLDSAFYQERFENWLPNYYVSLDVLSRTEFNYITQAIMNSSEYVEIQKLALQDPWYSGYRSIYRKSNFEYRIYSASNPSNGGTIEVCRF